MPAKIPEAEDLNLTPIMNCVLVLIPLMLLNVVFMKISIIDVTMPQRSAGAAQNSGDPPLRLQLFISQQGFTVVKGQETLPAIQGCDSGGPTICLENPDAELFIDRHKWHELYNALLEIKLDPTWHEHDTIEIVADSTVNYGTIIKTMDVARYQLVAPGQADSAIKGEKMGSIQELNDARSPFVPGTDANGNSIKQPLAMFPTVVLGMPTVTQ